MEFLVENGQIARAKVLWQENSLSAIPIALSVPTDFLIQESINDYNDALHLIKHLSPLVEKLAQEAFFQQQKSAWDDIQKILYLWNMEDLFRRNEITSGYKSIVQNILRKKIIDIKLAATNLPTFEFEGEFSPQKAVVQLADRASSHRINYHPLLAELEKNGLPLDGIKTFINNYFVNNRLFHLFIVTLSLFTPLERRTELANNFYDELGGGDNQLAHPILFLKNFNTMGRPHEIEPLPESLYLANEKLFAAYLSGDYHYGMGGFGCIELTMPNQMRKILNGLKLSNLPRKDLEFWEIHISIDIEHGKTWFNEMLNLITTPEEAQSCLQGGMALLDARASMYDGIWNCICKNNL